MAISAQATLPPPRLVGNWDADGPALRDWLFDFYKSSEARAIYQSFHELTIEGAATSGEISFTAVQGYTPHAFAVCRGSSGAPPDGAFIVAALSTDGTTATLALRAAPGTGNAVSFEIGVYFSLDD